MTMMMMRMNPKPDRQQEEQMRAILPLRQALFGQFRLHLQLPVAAVAVVLVLRVLLEGLVVVRSHPHQHRHQMV